MRSAAWKSVLLFLVPLAPAGMPLAAQGHSAATPSQVRIEHQDSFTVVGLTVRTTNAREASEEGEIPKLWQRAMEDRLLDQIPARADDNIIVVYSDYASDHNGEYDYTLGVRVTLADKVPDGLVVKTIRAGRYAVFPSKQGPPQEVVPALWQRINAMTPEEQGGTRAYQTDFEVYPPFTDPNELQMMAYIGLR